MVWNHTDNPLIFNENFPQVRMIFLHYSSLVWISSLSCIITWPYICKPYYTATGKNSTGIECSRIYETERKMEKEGKERKGENKTKQNKTLQSDSWVLKLVAENRHVLYQVVSLHGVKKVFLPTFVYICCFQISEAPELRGVYR